MTSLAPNADTLNALLERLRARPASEDRDQAIKLVEEQLAALTADSG